MFLICSLRPAQAKESNHADDLTARTCLRDRSSAGRRGGLPYQTQILGYDDSMKGADYLAINPMRGVPAIVHRGKVVTEWPRSAPIWPMLFPMGLAPPLEARADHYRRLSLPPGRSKPR